MRQDQVKVSASILGLDFDLKIFLTTSEGEKIESPLSMHLCAGLQASSRNFRENSAVRDEEARIIRKQGLL
jgi:hypothetical protein